MTTSAVAGRTGVGIRAGAVLREGARGAEVRALQQRLAALGFHPGTPDGDFGGRTEAALRAFQRSRGLTPDGVAGPRTLAALGGAAPPRPRPAAPAAGDTFVRGRMRDHRDLARFARAHGFHVTAGRSGRHNPGSSHYEGKAVDVRTRDKSAAQIQRFIRAAQAAGIQVHDERRRPRGQAVWSGPHLHLQVS